MIQYRSSKEEFYEQINESLVDLNNMNSLYNKKIELYSKFLSKRYEYKNKDELYSIIEKTEKSFSEFIKQLERIEDCKKALNIIKDMYNNGIDCNKEIELYNEEYKNIKNVYFNNSIYDENIMLEQIESQIDKNSEENNKEELNKVCDNGTLLISEVKNQVILPYTGKEIEEIFENNPNKYINYDEVIKDKYTRSLSEYKNLRISRVREGYKLLTERENYSKIQASDIMLELFNKRFLHPAIISACRSLDELDVYLDCLDKNELDDFRIFNIQYEMYPIVVKEQSILARINIFLRIIEFLKRKFTRKKARRMRYD